MSYGQKQYIKNKLQQENQNEIMRKQKIRWISVWQVIKRQFTGKATKQGGEEELNVLG